MKDQHTSTSDELEMERITCQMKALIRAKWPERYSVKRAPVTLIQGGKASANRFPFVQDDQKDWTPSPLAFDANASAIVDVLP
jgi:sensor domain CHASE-containing protein